MLMIQNFLLPKSPKEATNNAIMKGIFFGALLIELLCLPIKENQKVIIHLPVNIAHTIASWQLLNAAKAMFHNNML